LTHQKRLPNDTTLYNVNSQILICD